MQTIKKGRTPHSRILKTAAGLLALGRSDFADVEYFRQDWLFREVLGGLQVLIHVACKVVSHANSKIIKFGRHSHGSGYSGNFTQDVD